MNTKYPFFFLWRFRLLIIFGTLCVAGIGLAYALLSPTVYDTSISFSINRISKQETPDYQYDGYYAIQASDLFSQTVLSWFLTPSVLLEIYDGAGIDPNVSSIEQLTSRFKAKKYSAQNIVVRFIERDKQTADKISGSLVKVIEERARTSNQDSGQQAWFDVQGATPFIVEKRPSPGLMTGIGAAVGIILSVSAAYAMYSLRETDQEKQPGRIT